MGSRALNVATALVGAVVCIATSGTTFYGGVEATDAVGPVLLDADNPGQIIEAVWTTDGTDVRDGAVIASLTLTLENYGTSSGRIGLFLLDAPWDGEPPDEAAVEEALVIGGGVGSTPFETEITLRATGVDVLPGEIHLLLWDMDGVLDLEGEGELLLTLSCYEECPDTTMDLEVQ